MPPVLLRSVGLFESVPIDSVGKSELKEPLGQLSAFAWILGFHCVESLATEDAETPEYRLEAFLTFVYCFLTT